MGKKLKRYLKPKISERKVKINFFLSNITWVDQFSLLGDVYAQSGDQMPSGDLALAGDMNGDGQFDGVDDGSTF